MKTQLMILTAFLVTGAAHAVPARADGMAPARLLPSNMRPGKNLDFEGDYIEGMNKKPQDSSLELSEADKRRRKTHLYKKRTGFSLETTETIEQVRYN